MSDAELHALAVLVASETADAVATDKSRADRGMAPAYGEGTLPSEAEVALRQELVRRRVLPEEQADGQ